VKRVTLYTDGACRGNPGPGGWGAVLEHGRHRRELLGAEPATTNNRMELRAAIEGLRALSEACEVDLATDSTYVMKGITEWLQAWKARGWKTAARKPVANADLWQELEQEASRHRVHWRWVKGHSGDVGNERADALANAAIDAMQAGRTAGGAR
jgi:ribonuclease HI